MEIKTVKIENPESMNMILGQSHFIKTVEDIYETMVSTVPMAKFGLAFCEASDVCLVRHTGTDNEMLELAQKNAYALSAGHSFIIFMKDMYPVNVLNAIKNVPEVCRIFCATANPVQAVIAETAADLVDCSDPMIGRRCRCLGKGIALDNGKRLARNGIAAGPGRDAVVAGQSPRA